MSALQVGAEPMLLVEVLDADTVFQNQGPYLVQFGFTADLDDDPYTGVFESELFPAGAAVWARAPTANQGTSSTIFWSVPLGDEL